MTEHYASKMRAMNCAVLPKLNPIEKCDYAAEFWWKYARKSAWIDYAAEVVPHN